jgi:stage III sporulation protein AH
MAKFFQAKKLFSRVGRRNLIILSAVLLIGVAVYLNYLWFYDGSSIGYGENNMVDQLGPGGDQSAGGDGELDYFTAAELARQQARDEAMEVLQSVVDASTEDSQERIDALSQLSKIAMTMEDEANIESLVLAKGFEQCVAVISGDKASIIVSSEEELTAAQNAQICTIVYETAEILPKNVTISCK